MAKTRYTYDKDGADYGLLCEEILAAGLSAHDMDSPLRDSLEASPAPNLSVGFTDALSAGEITTLDGVIAAHPGPPASLVDGDSTILEDVSGSPGLPVVDGSQLTGVIGIQGPAGADGDVTWEGAWVSQNYTANQAVGYLGESYVCKLNTVASEVPTDATYWDLMASKGDVGADGPATLPFCDVAHEQGQIATTSTSHILATGMTLTPPAGTYAVTFAAAGVHATGSSDDVYTQIYADGVAQGVEMFFRRGGNQGDNIGSLTAVAKVVVNGSQAIEGRWRQSGGTGQMQGRSLMLMEVSA
jgi:hypothetical protein